MAHGCALWRRWDEPGHEFCEVRSGPASWSLAGSAVFRHENEPCLLEYAIVCDPSWRTRSARIRGWLGREPVAIELAVDDEQRWWSHGVECAGVQGAVDLDLAFSPATNLLPIRRLELALGESANVRAAWLVFPELALKPLDQIYRRTHEAAYRFEAPSLGFAAELRVNEEGVVAEYPGLWTLEAFVRAPEGGAERGERS